jgi:hypothetical protein
VGLLERDQAAGELGQREVVLRFLRPTDEYGAVAVEPGVAGLDDPAPRSPSRRGSFELKLLAAATEVGCVAAAVRELVDPRVGVTAVEAEALRIVAGRRRPQDRDRVEGRG